VPWSALEMALVDEPESSVEVDVEVEVEEDVEEDVEPVDVEPVESAALPVDVVLDVVAVVFELAASVAVVLTPTTKPTVVMPATAAVLQPATRVRRRSRRTVKRGSGLRGSGVFIPATMRSGGSGPHQDNVKPVLTSVRCTPCLACGAAVTGGGAAT
jgi:hypothetical protein